MNVVQGMLLGLIQGLGEFLPVSSSGHLLLARLLFGIQTESPALKMLDILLHIGTLIPVLLVFRKEWIDMLVHPLKNKTLVLLFVASLPTLAIYMLAKVLLPDLNGFAVFNSGWFLGGAFLLTALFLLICDKLAEHNKRNRTPGVFHALVMGLFQGIGLIPGVSRSGSTILGGTVCGLDKFSAARFSFMMSAPAILGSLLMEGKDALQEGYLSEIALVPSLIGIAVAAVTGFITIRMMLKLISRIPLAWFSLYLAVLGIGFLILQLSGSAILPPFAVSIHDIPVG